MQRKFGLLALVLISLLIFACHKGGKGDVKGAGDIYAPKPVVVSPYKAKVTDVFNDTHKVHEVDIIGLLWNGIQDSLKQRGMLWAPNTEGEPYTMEGHVVYFRKGGVAERFLPRLGDTVLEVRVELSQGGKHIATIESKRKIAFGRGTITKNAWKKVFEEVSEDVVIQAAKKFQ
jgi:hypothetical protein